MTTVQQVFRVHSTIEVPYNKLEEYLESPELPPEIDRLETTRRGNQVFIESVPADTSIGKYTPTATLRATVTDTRVYEHEGTRSRTEPSTPDDTEPSSEVVTFANFKGRLGTVIKNTALRAPMFVVLRDVATLADRGHLTAIIAEEDGLEAIVVRDGHEVPATVEVTDGNEPTGDVDTPDWQNSRT